ncbi:hypothetical protein YQE_05664, partial [Dendroctonus ponderosae]
MTRAAKKADPTDADFTDWLSKWWPHFEESSDLLVSPSIIGTPLTPTLLLVSEKFFELKRLKADEGFIRVQCRADGIFPKPVMTLHSQQRRIPEAIVQSKQEGHLYEISAQVTLPELEKPEEFSCKLHIPLANYTTRKTFFGSGGFRERSV